MARSAGRSWRRAKFNGGTYSRRSEGARAEGLAAEERVPASPPAYGDVATEAGMGWEKDAGRRP